MRALGGARLCAPPPDGRAGRVRGAGNLPSEGDGTKEKEPDMARIIRIMTRDGAARAVFAETRSIVDEAARIHHTAPTATAALGRVLTCASMMSSLLGEADDVLTLRDRKSTRLNSSHAR